MANGNGWASQLAAFRTGQGTGAGMGLYDLLGKVTGDLRVLQKREDEQEQQYGEQQDKYAGKESKRGRDRIKGALLGAALFALTGGTSALGYALATGAGSYVGQKAGRGGVTWRTPLGRKNTLQQIVKSGSDTFFHQGRERKLDRRRDDINRWIKQADQVFDQNITTSALSDAYTAYKLGSLDWKGFASNLKNLKNLPSLAKGEISLADYKRLAGGGSLTRGPSPKGVGLRSGLGIGTLDKIREEGLEQMERNKKFYGAGYPDYFSRILSMDRNRLDTPKKFDYEEAMKLLSGGK